MSKYRWPPQKRLGLYLTEHDIQRQWLAEQTGLSQVTVSGIVTGRIRPTPRARRLIARALGRPSGRLFVQIEDPTDAELAEAQPGIMLDDEIIEQLRHLLFPSHTSRGTAPTRRRVAAKKH